jgi:hypothetical protein
MRRLLSATPRPAGSGQVRPLEGQLGRLEAARLGRERLAPLVAIEASASIGRRSLLPRGDRQEGRRSIDHRELQANCLASHVFIRYKRESTGQGRRIELV